ncbi:transmembrane and TPR repeat-containing protein 2-like [Elysia marginata]|uniref:Transmembrane and TPR repeat-containing protein 2-like n=1 Tax=Elysia marginata TaxID=1093978 RepID=A0AAV4FU82_9GAST|nr:transmembrane and TPR repeat-containing protein 2-like [Elysia marginata]
MPALVGYLNLFRLDESKGGKKAMGTLILILRMWVMDFQQPKFKIEDNPAAEATSRLTRILTFLHLPVVNLWLLLCPVNLSYDWTLGSVPLVTDIGDPRNVWTGLFYSGLLALIWRSARSLISQVRL